MVVVAVAVMLVVAVMVVVAIQKNGRHTFVDDDLHGRPGS